MPLQQPAETDGLLRIQIGSGQPPRFISAMETLNQNLFLLINAPANASPSLMHVAHFLAERLIWLAPGILLLVWLRGNEPTRQLLLEAAAAALLGLLIAQVIGALWPHPRPFAMGLGTNGLVHVANASFPSDHLTLFWSVGFGLLRTARLRPIGVSLGLLGLPMAWARIYLGVHFPMDMVGAALVAACSAWMCSQARGWFMPFIYPGAARLHQFLLAPLIKQGWIAK
jgi:undecaprenyl-diphosphatase